MEVSIKYTVLSIPTICSVMHNATPLNFKIFEIVTRNRGGLNRALTEP